MDALRQVKRLLSDLPVEDQERLHAFLGQLLAPAQVERAPVDATVRTREAVFWYRSEGVRCGKARCACREGKLHRPYVYKYWREGGRLRKAYVGKGVTPPPAAPPAGPARGSSGPSSGGPTPRRRAGP
ncbi:MAG TPA: hypothetical protein VNX21_00215 [Candidatus Thermoplasmatota archaeon]|nr:hypothetical protein [Candidatus Thermoplasmatota archaeon]